MPCYRRCGRKCHGTAIRSAQWPEEFQAEAEWAVCSGLPWSRRAAGAYLGRL